jgi:phosphoserine phosphatase
MNHLVIQHPDLSVGVIDAITGRVGARPSAHGERFARWTVGDLARGDAEAIGAQFGVDAGLVPDSQNLSDYRLIAFDMDSTLITIECVDEIADFVGRKHEVAAITEAAMRGEIKDYKESLRRRVALLAGLEESALLRVYEERLRITPGAETLITAAKGHGLRVLLVSGGFTFFTERLAPRLGLDFTHANVLEVQDGRLTGRLVGEIVDAAGKRETVLQTCARLGCEPSQAIVVGDGANDLDMMRVAGVSVAYHAKPVVKAQTTYGLDHCGLDAIVRLFADAPDW